jgi:hypothetical protein
MKGRFSVAGIIDKVRGAARRPRSRQVVPAPRRLPAVDGHQVVAYGFRSSRPASASWDLCNVERYMEPQKRDRLRKDLMSIKGRRRASGVDATLQRF